MVHGCFYVRKKSVHLAYHVITAVIHGKQKCKNGERWKEKWRRWKLYLLCGLSLLHIFTHKRNIYTHPQYIYTYNDTYIYILIYVYIFLTIHSRISRLYGTTICFDARSRKTSKTQKVFHFC